MSTPNPLSLSYNPNPNKWNSASIWGQGGGQQPAPNDWITKIRADPNASPEALLGVANYEETIRSNAERELAAKKATVPKGPWAQGAETFSGIAQGVASLGSVYMGLKNMKLQKEAFQFNKGMANTNMNNSIGDFNRRLGETLSNRALNNGQGQGWVSDQLAKYSAKRS